MKERKEVISQITREPFDVVVIGGGITGSSIVRDSAMRGLKSLLIDKGDFAVGTSSRSGKLVHGGLRYLKYCHFGLVFESCREREALSRVVAPHIVKKTQFIYPFYKENRTPRWLVLAGLFLYDVLSHFRNGSPLHYVSSQKLREFEPYLRQENAQGAASFYDCTCIDSRLTIDTVKGAVAAGASVVNYACFVGLDKAQANGHAVFVRDELTGQQFTVKARVVVNASGAWADEVLGLAKSHERFGVKITSGIHVVLPRTRLPLQHTLSIESIRDGRYLYAVPWKDNVLVGTTDRYYHADKDRVVVGKEDVNYLIDSMNFYFPQSHLVLKDIHSAYAGIRPLVGSDKGKKEETMSRDYSIMVEPQGLVSITGGKLTTCRSMAETIMNQVVKNFFRRSQVQKCQTLLPISGAKPIEENDGDGLLPVQVVTSLKNRYGSNWPRILAYVRQDRTKGELFSKNINMIKAELDYLVAAEFVESLADVMFRRTQIYLQAPGNGRAEAAFIADYIGKLKGWSAAKVADEVARYEEELAFLLGAVK